MFILSLTYLESDFLRFFTQYREIEGWEDTALSWILAAIVISVCVAGMMVLIKAYKKYSAANIKSRTWSGGQTWLLILVGLFPVMLLSCVIWYFSRDFHNIVGIQGLFKGIAFSWLLYLLFMVLAHLVSPWRNEIQ